MSVQQNIAIRPLNLQTFRVSILGDSMIQHQMDEKVRKMMIEKQMGKTPAAKREKRDPKKEFENSLHTIRSGKFTYKGSNELGLGEVDFSGIVGFPAYGVKAAIVDSARNVDGITMTLLRGAMFIKGDDNDLVPINYKRMLMREDPVVIGKGTTDLRYRAEDRKSTRLNSSHGYISY